MLAPANAAIALPARRQAGGDLGVSVALDRRVRLELVREPAVDAGEAGREHQAGIGVGAGDAVLDAARPARLPAP